MRSRGRVHPSKGNEHESQRGGSAFTDVKGAWLPESPEPAPGARTVSNASGGSLVPLLQIDEPDSKKSVPVPPLQMSKVKERGLIGGEAVSTSARSAGSVGFGSTPRLSARKHHGDENEHRAPSCSSYYAWRNRCGYSYSCRFMPRARAQRLHKGAIAPHLCSIMFVREEFSPQVVCRQPVVSVQESHLAFLRGKAAHDNSLLSDIRADANAVANLDVAAVLAALDCTNASLQLRYTSVLLPRLRRWA